jgi:hypothetical protein
VLSVALVLAVAGCGGGSTTPKQTASGAVTPEAGGTVKLADDSVKLDVPPGAVPANTTIKMTTTDAAAPQGITAASPILQFEPDGIVFAKPITVTFTFKNATKPIVYWSNHSGGYDLIPGTVSGSTISAPVTHFSMGFVGEEPAGSTDTCGAGVACGAGTSCGYGGTPNGDGSGTPADASVNAGGGGTQTSGGGSPAGAADASAPSSTGDQAGAASSPLSSGGGGTGMCCSCINGTFQCSTCSAPVGGGDDAGVPACVEGASCAQPGAGCGGTPTTSGGGGSTNGGTGPSAADASVSRAGSAGSCCMCGTDGKVHCGLTCTPSAGLDGGANNADATTNGGGGSGGKCEPGDPCQASAAPCRNASPSSCLSCMCGADGKLACMPCDDAPPPPPDGGAPAQCTSGAKCQPGSGGCESTSSGTCLQCRCDANGVLACAPCGSANDAGVPPPPPSDASTGPSDCVPHGTCAQGAICDAKGADGQCMTCKCDQTGSYQCVPCAGTQPPPDGGAAPPPPSCVQGGACLAEGMLCDAKSPDGGCMTCKCGADGTYQCGSCAGAPPPPSDASAPPPPQACVQGAKCPSPGATCGGADGAGACTQCTCSVDGILSCKPCP